MFDLAVHYGEGAITLKEVAARQNLSEPYLEQLMAPLRKAGLVRSLRGAQGGYLLTREPAAITVGDIIRVLEGPIAPVDCVIDDAGAISYCGRAEACVTRDIWRRLRDSITALLDSISLADLCRDALNSPAAGEGSPVQFNQDERKMNDA